jgi:simple sugar transport system permease protein
MELAESLLKTALALATPLLLAALGEIVSERAGVLNIGVEGLMLIGALAGVAGCFLTGSPWFGLLLAVAVGTVISAAYGAMAIGLQVDQVVAGTGVNIFALGVTAALRREIFGDSGATFTVAALPAWRIPGVADIPLLGPILFTQDPVVHFALVLTAVASWMLFHTRGGLELRAAGENPAAADSGGLSVARLRWRATLICGALCGLAGGHLSLGLSNTFVEGMTAGRGFIALAIVIVSRWTPYGALLTAILFGLANAVQYRFQALGLSNLPHQLFLALPYVLTLAAAAAFSRRVGAPAALGRPYIRE